MQNVCNSYQTGLTTMNRAIISSVLVHVLAVSSAMGQASSGNRESLDRLSSSAQLIAAMPDQVESVMILRAKPLLAEGNPWNREMDAWFKPRNEYSGHLQSRQASTIDNIVFSEVTQLNPVVRLMGGWDFKMPQSIGTSSFRFIHVWITQDSNGGVRERLRHEDSIDELQRDALTIYQAPVPIAWDNLTTETLPVHVAFPNAHVTIVACSSADITHVAGQLKSPNADMPARWREAASAIDIESPVVILRKMKSEGGMLDILPAADSFAVACHARTRVYCDIHIVVAPEGDTDSIEAEFQSVLSITNGYWSGDWHSKARSVAASLEHKPNLSGPYRFAYIYFTLFGVFIAI